MGCGAVCGSQSTVAESSRQAQVQFMSLFKQITPNLFLYPVKAIAKFTKQMQLNPHRFQLVLTQKLQPKHMISMGVIEKWKIILFGLDCDRPAYVNCLGYPETCHKAKSVPDKQQTDEAGNQRQATGIENIQKVQVIQHKAFTQIEKDIERTFPGIEFQKKSFTMILKRITNHFPTMGYTQGINFIVGYLLIIGFSQSDAFWFFIHFAINRRYMMLGLYEDGFPLINVYTSIFRNMLKRLKPKLYTHLYQNVVMFQQSAWVFKWFMTCFLSSFPIQMCQYVWDMVICNGGISLVYFAMSLVLKLEKQLLQMEDACDISQFLNSLRDIQTFNRYLSIREVVKQAYKIKLQSQDLSQLRQVKTQRGGNNLYAQYFLFKYQQQITEKTRTPRLEKTQLARVSEQLHQSNPILFKKLSGSRSSQLLNQWYQRLTKEREQFHVKSLIKQPVSASKSNTIIIALDHSQQLSGQPGLPSDIELPKNSRVSIQQFGSLIRFDVDEQIGRASQLKNNSNRYDIGNEFKQQDLNGQSGSKGQSSIQVSPSNKQKNSMSRYTNKKLRKQQSIWKDDDEEQQRQQNKDKINRLQDQFFYISRDIRFKRKNMTYQSQDALTDLIKKTTKPKQINNNYIPNQNYLKPDSQTNINTQVHISSNPGNINHSRLARVGNAVLSNMSASNASNKSSASSYRTNNHKQNPNSTSNSNPMRHCKCMKNKTEENQVETISKPASRKNIEKVNQPEEIIQYEQSANLTNARKRLNTYHDWMANSQGPREARNLASSNVKQASQIGSQVEIIHGREMFKKKNRISGRIGGGVGVVHECPHIVENQISDCQSRIVPTPVLADQESVQSFIIANVSSRRSDLAEIESVK